MVWNWLRSLSRRQRTGPRRQKNAAALLVEVLEHRFLPDAGYAAGLALSDLHGFAPGVGTVDAPVSSVLAGAWNGGGPPAVASVPQPTGLLTAVTPATAATSLGGQSLVPGDAGTAAARGALAAQANDPAAAGALTVAPAFPAAVDPTGGLPPSYGISFWYAMTSYLYPGAKMIWAGNGTTNAVSAADTTVTTHADGSTVTVVEHSDAVESIVPLSETLAGFHR